MAAVSMRNVLAAVCLAVMVLTACSRRPGDVLDTDEMASLMADMHMAQAMVEYNRAAYRSDSLKQVVMQSVLRKHGVTTAQFDESLQWYGHNMKQYMEVYDATIAILEQRLADMGSKVAAEQALSISGDSVNVWGGPRYLALNSNTATNIITFAIKRDEHWQRGDIYTFRAKILNPPGKVRGSIAARYDDGAVEFFNLSTDGEGWKELRFIVDSTRVASDIYGYLAMAPEPGVSVYVDSIELVRSRLAPTLYGQRYRQRLIKFGDDDAAARPDTLAASKPQGVEATVSASLDILAR